MTDDRTNRQNPREAAGLREGEPPGEAAYDPNVAPSVPPEAPEEAPGATREGAAPPADTAVEESAVYLAPQWKLIWWRFKKHRLAMIGMTVTILIYLVALFCEFLAPSTQGAYDARFTYAPPQGLHFFSEENGFGPYVYGYTSKIDEETLERTFTIDESKEIPIRFFDRGESYEMWGLFESNVHLIGPVPDNARLYILGADRSGRDLLSRIIYGTRVSMSIGLVGVAVSLVLGVVLGGASGYYGGGVDTIIQRLIEFLMSIPTLPLWLGLAAAVPAGWGPLKVYFAIVIILSLISWTDLARVVRGRFLSLRSEDFVMAAELDGSSKPRIILRHMLPSFSSHIIATLTLSIPAMVLAETALSFLGLGLQPPVVSWGVLLQEAQNIRSVATAPWLLLPGVGVIVAVLALNFMGDGLRDSADPYR
jgi:peptide/nickel transport system permease protein